MPRPREKQNEINAGSMADIAFLLLVFFLVTTTMDSSWGIQRKLPPPPEPNQDNIDIKQRNVFVVLANANDQLLVEGELLVIEQVREKAKEFIVNPARKENLPEWEDVSVAIAKQKIIEYTELGNPEKIAAWQKRLAAAELLGNYTITKQVISLQNDRGTSYKLYIQVQNELAAAYRELRDDLCMQEFRISFTDLEQKSKDNPGDASLKKKLKAIKTVYPQKISEAEPKNLGG
ncbi:MAG: biopolymer transporter ExbD [Flavobacteriales bacterium]|nr:biopolymer transporter ExbD [Flavobacteriales bacterium]